MTNYFHVFPTKLPFISTLSVQTHTIITNKQFANEKLHDISLYGGVNIAVFEAVKLAALR